MKHLVEKELYRLLHLKFYKDSYLTYLFEHILLIFYWYYKHGIVTTDDEIKLEENQDYDELIQFSRALKENLSKFDVSVKKNY